MEKLIKSLISGTLATAILSIAIQANAVANSSTDNQIIMLGNQQVSVDQVPKPPELVKASVFDGFYLGFGPSLIATTGEAKADMSHSTFQKSWPAWHKFPLSDYEFGATGFGGYGKTYHQNLYLGGELFANYAPLKTKGFSTFKDVKDPTKHTEEIQHALVANVKSYYALGAILRVGYLLSPKAMIYVLAGGDFSQFKGTSNDSTRYEATPTGISPSFTKNVIGFMPGLGIEAMLNKNWALRAQYTYSLYPKFTDTYTLGYDVKMKYNLARSIYNVAAVYHFDPSGAQNPRFPQYDTPEKSLSNGWYLGIGPELMAATGKVIREFNSGEYKFYEKNSEGISSYYPGAVIFGGYGNSYKQKWYVGSELFGAYSPLRSRLIFDEGILAGKSESTRMTLVRLKSDFSYGAALRGGYMLSPESMIYALLGIDFTQFKANSYSGRHFAYIQDYASPQKTKNVIGFMPGIGFESMINQNLSVRVQYTYSLYRSFTDNYTRTEHIWGHYRAPEKVKYEPARSTFSLLLSYYFNSV